MRRQSPKPDFARSLWGVALAAGAGLALLLALYLPSLRQRVQGKTIPPKIQSLAVSPLENLSGDPAQEYFADGMTDAVITDLAQISALRVISRTSVMRYKGTRKPLPEIVKELNVDGVVEGAGGPIGGAAPWASTYERNLGDVLTLQSEVAQAIAHAIQL
ncbi:MAG TPA: hypothetical protein VKE24_16205 [Candidatus Acidoferrales bacterium]|nr:hypothetical protein [Candidatus Acidoferrales bacterium]